LSLLLPRYIARSLSVGPVTFLRWTWSRSWTRAADEKKHDLSKRRPPPDQTTAYKNVESAYRILRRDGANPVTVPAVIDVDSSHVKVAMNRSFCLTRDRAGRWIAVVSNRESATAMTPCASPQGALPPAGPTIFHVSIIEAPRTRPQGYPLVKFTRVGCGAQLCFPAVSRASGRDFGQSLSRGASKSVLWAAGGRARGTILRLCGAETDQSQGRKPDLRPRNAIVQRSAVSDVHGCCPVFVRSSRTRWALDQLPRSPHELNRNGPSDGHWHSSTVGSTPCGTAAPGHSDRSAVGATLGQCGAYPYASACAAPGRQEFQNQPRACRKESMPGDGRDCF